MLNEKHDAKKEHQLQLLAENRIQSGQYKIFDQTARVITRSYLKNTHRSVGLCTKIKKIDSFRAETLDSKL